MAWIRIDDGMPGHPKIEPLSDAAFRWVFHALSYANRFLTDGALPPVFLARVPDVVTHELVAAGVWDRARGRVSIHDYAQFQPTKATVEQRRQQSRDRQARFRQRLEATGTSAPSATTAPETAMESNAVSHAVTNASPNAVTAPLVTAPRPDPSRPVPKDQRQDPPNPPAARVAGGKITRKERAEAERIRHNSYIRYDSYCPHVAEGDPQCENTRFCVGRIVQRLREAEAAGVDMEAAS